MKVRVGVAAGAGVVGDPADFFELVDALDDLGYDSLWVPDIITTPTFDPIAALAAAAGRRARLKVGTHIIVPGRNPVLLAKQLASLDRLSAGRLLLLAVIGIRRPEELAAQGVEAGDRTAVLEESLEVMRALWRGETVSFQGQHVKVDGVTLGVRPVQDPLEVWLGGRVPAALRRCGRIGEGWMPGLVTPAEAAADRAVIDDEAAKAGRQVDGEHYGVNLLFHTGKLDDQIRAQVAARRDDVDAEDVVAVGAEGLAEQMAAFIEVGFSKFVIRPALEPESWSRTMADVADVVALQT